MILKRNLLYAFLNTTQRFYSHESRVRFAPSPTGYLHLGGLRTALYNYFFAKSRNGKFVLRIEDTDQTRLVEGATKQLQTDLEWAGIKIDEGPGIGGDYGPYIQSQRLDIYRDNVEKLLENGSAYRCFCSEKRLDLLRKEALRTRQVPKYDNKCRGMSKDELRKRLSRNEKHCIRFKLLADCETFEDMIYGNIAYDVALNEGDPVIIKADGYPTYHFANVVDDHYMKITHVLRGVEWQISTTKHILMYRAFGWEPPVYGHLPLMLNSDNTKLSKRQDDIRVASYRESGILPQALVNFVTDCGGGFIRPQGIKMQSYDMDELISQFDIGKVNSHSTKITPEKLLEFNRLELIKQIENEERCTQMVQELQRLITERFSDKTLQLNDDYVKSILKWSTPRINKLTDLVSKDLSFLWVSPSTNQTLSLNQLEIITNVNLILRDATSFDKVSLMLALKQLAKNQNLSFGKLMSLIRQAISGLKEGPGVLEMIEILGISNTINRLDNYVKMNRR